MHPEIAQQESSAGVVDKSLSIGEVASESGMSESAWRKQQLNTGRVPAAGALNEPRLACVRDCCMFNVYQKAAVARPIHAEITQHHTQSKADCVRACIATGPGKASRIVGND